MNPIETSESWAVTLGAIAAELADHRDPTLIAEDRLPIGHWPRDIPIDGQPEDTAKSPHASCEQLKRVDFRKRPIAATAGAIIQVPLVQSLQEELSNLGVASIGPGLHDNQATASDQISAALQTGPTQPTHKEIS